MENMGVTQFALCRNAKISSSHSIAKKTEENHSGVLGVGPAEEVISELPLP